MALQRNTSLGLLLLLAAVLAIPSGTTLAADTVRGVTDTEIIIGTMTDLSGVTAVQSVNNVNAVRMAFDEANANGGVHGRKIKYIVEDMQYQVPKAVQAMNKLVNRDNIFFAIVNGGTPMNDAVMPMMFEKNVPNVFPLTAARSMYEPFNKFKFGQFASYYDEMRSGVKYFAEQKGRKSICAMYQDSDFGRDVFAGAEAEAHALGLQIIAQTAHAPTDTDFTSAVTKLREANCDMVVLGTIVRDTIIILQTAHKQGWNPDFVGQVATYSTAIAEAPGNPAEGFYAMTPALYAYPDDPRPEVKHVRREVQGTLWLRRELPRRNRLYRRAVRISRARQGGARPYARQLHQRFGEHAGLSRHLRFPAADHYAYQPPCRQPVIPDCGAQRALGAGGARTTRLLSASPKHCCRWSSGSGALVKCRPRKRRARPLRLTAPVVPEHPLQEPMAVRLRLEH